METILKLKIKSSGIKQNFLAEKIGVSPVYFSMCITGSRIMSDKKQQVLKDLLVKNYAQIGEFKLNKQ